jgi:RNA polymerase sigma factor (sigma-70 family)
VSCCPDNSPKDGFVYFTADFVELRIFEECTPRENAEGGVVISQSEWAAHVSAVAERRDRDAFACLFDHFVPRIEAYLTRLGADAATAEEISQDVMLTLWRKAALFDASKSSVTTWLYRIARNRRIDGVRRDRLDYVDPMDMALDEMADDVPADHAMDIQQREDILRAAIRELPEEQLSLVRLAFFESLSHSIIAERTGLPLGTVKSRIRLAFARLRRTLETQGVVGAI